MKFWIDLNLIIAITFCLYFVFKNFFQHNGKLKFETDFIKLLFVLMFFPLLEQHIELEVPLPPVVKRQVDNVINSSNVKLNAIKVKLPVINKKSIDNKYLIDPFAILFFMGIFIWLFRFSKDLYKLKQVINNAYIFKKGKKIKILVSEQTTIPCSFWFPGTFYVMLPVSLLDNTKSLKHAISHELQHHRQGDTKIIYILEIVKGIFYLNPFIHLWIKAIHENRELICDKEVLQRKKYPVFEYGKTLIDVVKINSGKVHNRTWAMASLNQIKRRIEMITISKKEKLSTIKRLTCLSFTIFLTWQTIAATNNSISLKKLTLEEAQAMSAQIKTKIPIEVNSSVLKWLNYFLADPSGKAFMIKSLERMHNYRSFVGRKLSDSDLPKELLAVPFMESGYNNSHVSSAKAAGIWQFIPSTARKYGLKVGNGIDERFNVGKLTDAAIAYYKDLITIKEFNDDWRLALIAYNSGEGALKRAIKKEGSHNPWKFNSLGDKEYLAKIMAGIILLKNPSQKAFLKPVEGRTTSKFGIRKSNFRGSHHHEGVDIAAKLGTPILAPLTGKVIEAKFKKGFGNNIVIDHGSNIITMYAHLDKINVKTGDFIEEDQEIGTVGSTGISTGPHLHFEVIINGKNVNPEIFF